MRWGHLRDCGHVTPGTGSGVCYPGAYGGVTPVAGARKGPHPGARGHVIPGSGFGRCVTTQTVDMGSQAQGLGVVTLEMLACEPWGRVGRRSLWRLWLCVPRCSVGSGVTLETVGVRPQAQGLGWDHTLEYIQ